MPVILIYALAAGSAFLVAFLCLTTSRLSNRNAVRWLSLFLVSLGSALLGYVAWNGGYSVEFPYLLPLLELTRFAMAPALYISVWYFTKPQPMKSWLVWVHFLPALLFLLGVAPYFLAQLGIMPTRSTTFLPPSLSLWVGRIVGILPQVQFFIYLFLSFRLLQAHQHNLRQLTSILQGLRLEWLYGLLAAVVVMFVLWINEAAFLIPHINDYAAYGYLLGIYLIGYFLFQQSEVFAFSLPEKQEIQEILETPVVSKNKHARLSPDEMAQLKQRLNYILEVDKLFTDSQLNLAKLALDLGISMNDLSYLINEGYGINFFNLINSYRIEEAKRLLISNKYKHLTLLGIAYEVGFTSKSTFNAAFKKYTQQTPSEYIKAYKNP